MCACSRPSDRTGRPFFRLQTDQCLIHRAAEIPRAVGFHKTGMYWTVGSPAGTHATVYILERRFSTLSGNSPNIPRAHGRRIVPSAIIQTEELVEHYPPLVTENLKGLALRRRDAGKASLYIISDENFHNLQCTIC